MSETSMRVGNASVYGFLEPQSIQRSRQLQFELEYYVKKWMQNSQRDVYLAAYLNLEDYIMQYFIDPIPLEPKIMKAIRIQWTRCYLKVKNETLGV